MSNETIALSRTQARAGRRRSPHLPKWLLLTVAVAVLLGGIGGIYAWNMHEAGQENILQSHNTSVRINETFPNSSGTVGSTRTKQVSFTNMGSSPVFLRVAYMESWKKDSEWLEDDGTRTVKNWTSAWTSEWVLMSDGWYYYKKVLPANGTTSRILESVSFLNMPYQYANSDYSLDFLVECVQLSDEEKVNTQATQAVFGREGIVTVTSTLNGAVTAGTVSWS